MRIVSLLPAATEIVCALGLQEDLVGISHACDFPAGVARRPAVTIPSSAIEGGTGGGGGTAAGCPGAPAGSPPLTVDRELLASLHPDLVLVPAWRGMGGAGTDLAAVIREAIGRDATIVTLEPTSLEGVFHDIATIGAMTEAEDEAVGLVELLRERLADVEEVVEERREGGTAAPRVIALDWLDPPSAAGLWVPEQVRRAGGWELIGADGAPSVPTTWESIVDLDPEMLLLAPCGLRLADAVRAWRSAPRPPSVVEIVAVRRGQVFALDASAYFSRPGPRLIEGIELLAEIFDPAAFVDLAPAGSWVPIP